MIKGLEGSPEPGEVMIFVRPAGPYGPDEHIAIVVYPDEDDSP